MTDVEMSFLKAMQSHGLAPAVPPSADGELHRVHDTKDKPGKKDIYYRLYDDGFPEGFFGHWARLETIKWYPKVKSALTSEERSQLEKVREQRRLIEEKELQQQRIKCRKEAEYMLSKAIEADPTHPYLMRKKVKAYGIKQLGDTLLIPLHKHGVLTGLQRIMPDGNKRFLSGSEISGSSFIIPGDNSTIYLVEGYATAATINQVTGKTVACAFNCGNLLAIARILKSSYPDSELVICADDDRHTPGNPGLTKARYAALATGAKLAIPSFGNAEGTDFNDMMCLEKKEVDNGSGY